MPIEVGWVDPGIFDWGGGRGVETLIQKRLLNFFVENYPGEGGGGWGTPLQEAFTTGVTIMGSHFQ